MSTRPDVLKELLKDKGKLTTIPENGEIAVILKEFHDPDSKKVTYEIGVGKVWSYRRYFDVVGFALKELSGQFEESSVRTQIDEVTKAQPEKPVLIAIFPMGFQRTIDENKWGDKFSTLDDLIRILQEF